MLDEQLRLKERPVLRFAGQITGVEGYIESAAIGGMTGQMAASDLLGLDWQAPPIDTAHGALLSHLTGGAMADSFQPMNVNFGLFPPLEMVTVEGKKPRKLRGRDRKAAYAGRALSSLAKWANVTLPEELAHIG